MIFHLGTHEPTWIGRSPVPLFCSVTRAKRFGKKASLAGWACDSGGFTQLLRGGWTTSPEEYLESVYKLDDKCAGMMWAAPQDWMCEPSALAATGKTVEEHMQLTVANYLELKDLDDRNLIIPVLQGWEPGDHERCEELYRSAGVDLRDERLVGVGSICRRQASDEIQAIIESLAAGGLTLHGFGVKTRGLNRYAPSLHSADSLAWAYQAWKKSPEKGALCGGTHKTCGNCYVWAHQWRENVLRRL